MTRRCNCPCTQAGGGGCRRRRARRRAAPPLAPARERYAAQVVQQTLVPVAPPLFGSYEALVPASPRAVIERLNAAIRGAAREDGVLLLDLAWHAAAYGDGPADPVRWYRAKQLVGPALAPLYGDHLARIAAATAGLSHKCLVLDLDNTLWAV